MEESGKRDAYDYHECMWFMHGYALSGLSWRWRLSEMRWHRWNIESTISTSGLEETNAETKRRGKSQDAIWIM